MGAWLSYLIAVTEHCQRACLAVMEYCQRAHCQRGCYVSVKVWCMLQQQTRFWCGQCHHRVCLQPPGIMRRCCTRAHCTVQPQMGSWHRLSLCTAYQDSLVLSAGGLDVCWRHGYPYNITFHTVRGACGCSAATWRVPQEHSIMLQYWILGWSDIYIYIHLHILCLGDPCRTRVAIPSLCYAPHLFKYLV